MTDAVLTERIGRTLVITLNRAAKRNAINPDLTRGLDEALNLLEDDSELWVGVLGGGPTFFSAGADLGEGPGEPTERGGIGGIISRVRSKPLIAAVEGFALGGGLELVLCCDLVVAAQGARFGFPEVKRGLMPDFGGVFRAPRAFPANVAREMLLTGDPISAERAEQLGFVNQLVEPGQTATAALDLAARIAVNAPLAVRESLALAQTEINGNEAAAWVASNAAHQRLLASADVIEGVGAFFEKREPRWQGH